MPGKLPRATVAQAQRTEPRRPDRYPVRLGGGRQRDRLAQRRSVERQARIPGEQHPLERGRSDRARDRSALQLLCAQHHAIAASARHAAPAAIESERSDHVTGSELECLRVAVDIAGQALPIDRGEPERQRSHAAARRGCWRPAPTSAAYPTSISSSSVRAIRSAPVAIASAAASVSNWVSDPITPCVRRHR